MSNKPHQPEGGLYVMQTPSHHISQTTNMMGLGSMAQREGWASAEHELEIIQKAISKAKGF